MKTPIEQLDKLARYLIHNYGDMVKVDDMSNEDAVDEAIKILEYFHRFDIDEKKLLKIAPGIFRECLFGKGKVGKYENRRR